MRFHVVAEQQGQLVAVDHSVVQPPLSGFVGKEGEIEMDPGDRNG
jgi:hypothetical protein